MKNRVTEDQNTMYHEGKVYEACEVPFGACAGCSFYVNGSGCTCTIHTYCGPTPREDDRPIIWKLKDTTYNYSTRVIRLLKP